MFEVLAEGLSVMSESTILIVDDEAAIRDMVSITLDLAGFTSISAENAHDAHVAIIDKKPDLVLLDWMLPGGSGIELARRLRRDQRARVETSAPPPLRYRIAPSSQRSQISKDPRACEVRLTRHRHPARRSTPRTA